jgi:hypothetical protein
MRPIDGRPMLRRFWMRLGGSSTDTAMMAFRSIVLTPILQRQLFGIHDAYTPYVRSTISEDNDTELTIEVVTKFYLGEDPIDPVNIPTYRRNLIYLPEARWHLGLTMKVLGEKPEPKALGLYFSKIQDHHDIIMKALKDNVIKYDDDGFPLLSHAERSAIIEEKLELFFAEELARPVRHILPLASLCLPIIDNIEFVPGNHISATLTTTRVTISTLRTLTIGSFAISTPTIRSFAIGVTPQCQSSPLRGLLNRIEYYNIIPCTAAS